MLRQNKLHMRSLMVLMILFIFMGTLWTKPVKAETGNLPSRESIEPDYIDPETGYGLAILDEAGLFTYDETVDLIAEMMDFLQYGNAVVATTNENPFTSVQDLAIDYYDKVFGIKMGVIFLIDMDDREIFWYSEGHMYDQLSVKSAMAITDNVYSYAVDGEYAACCEEAFRQAVTVIKGGHIANSMKYIGNAFAAILLALFLNYAYARKTSYIRPAMDAKPEALYIKGQDMQIVKATFTKDVTHMRPRSSFYAGSSFGNSYSSGSSSYSSGGWSGSSGSSYSGGSHSSSSSSRSSSSSSSGHSGGGAGHRF